MAKNSQSNRWQSSLLAAMLAVAGILFVFDRLGSLVHHVSSSFQAVLHSSPILLVVVGVGLVLAAENAATSDPGAARPKGDQYEL